MSNLFARRAATNVDLTPLPKLVIPSPAPTSWVSSTEVVMDGIENGVQVKYNAKGRQYPLTSPGTQHYYTRGALPALVLKGTVRKGNFGQIALHLSADMEDLVKILLKTSHPVRYSLQRDSVKRIQTNFFPHHSQHPREEDVDDEDSEEVQKENVVLYLSETKQVSLTCFKENQECQVYVYPSTCAYNREKQLFKCRLAAVPLSSCNSLEFTQRQFDEDKDVFLTIPQPHLSSMVELFMCKWRHDEEYDEIAVSRAIFD